MKGRIKAAVQMISHAAAVITDWLLIGSGLLLFCVAAVRINVPLAKWFLLGCGLFFSGAGCWFRQRRKKRFKMKPSDMKQKSNQRSFGDL